jgi:hypothetical protein
LTGNGDGVYWLVRGSDKRKEREREWKIKRWGCVCEERGRVRNRQTEKAAHERVTEVERYSGGDVESGDETRVREKKRGNAAVHIGGIKHLGIS